LRDQRGTSLVEILCILAFLAILVLISIPSLVDLLRNLEVRGAAQALAQGFRRAQSLAVSDHKNFIIFVNPDNGSGPPNFCWDQPVPRRLYAIVEDDGKDCKITDCNAAKLRFWGPEIPRDTKFVRMPSGEAIDIGSGDFVKTLCYTSRGYVSKDTATGTGVYVGNDRKNMYRKTEVNITGRVKALRYVNSQYVE
jgi:type II secretory pathway pseudopilin PulG